MNYDDNDGDYDDWTPTNKMGIPSQMDKSELDMMYQPTDFYDHKGIMIAESPRMLMDLWMGAISIIADLSGNSDKLSKRLVNNAIADIDMTRAALANLC